MSQRRARDDPRDRQLRFVHVQPRTSPAGARRRGRGGAPPRAAGRRRPVPSRIGADAPGRSRPPWTLSGAMIQATLSRVLDGHDLRREEARETMGTIMRGEATPAQIAGFLVAL